MFHVKREGFPKRFHVKRRGQTGRFHVKPDVAVRSHARPVDQPVESVGISASRAREWWPCHHRRHHRRHRSRPGHPATRAHGRSGSPGLATSCASKSRASFRERDDRVSEVRTAPSSCGAVSLLVRHQPRKGAGTRCLT